MIRPLLWFVGVWAMVMALTALAVLALGVGAIR
jgi:hypothetical protein